MPVFLAFLLSAVSWSCQNQPAAPPEGYVSHFGDTARYELPYTLNDPQVTWELPASLKEISGLTMGAQDSTLIVVNDEKGIIFTLDTAQGKIIQETPFWKDGDYEGIERVGEDVWVIKSTGTLYQIQGMGTPEMHVEKFNGLLEKDQDVEGLGYDAFHHRLLLACKGNPGIPEKQSLAKACYAFDLNEKKFIDTPVVVIYLEDVHQFLQTATWLRKMEKLWEFFDPNSSELAFQPSALAVHPQTGDVYILSSVGKLLLVLSPEGLILHIEKMSKKVHAQPEGICFDSNGNLYISNEAKEEEAKIYRFTPQPSKPQE